MHLREINMILVCNERAGDHRTLNSPTSFGTLLHKCRHKHLKNYLRVPPADSRFCVPASGTKWQDYFSIFGHFRQLNLGHQNTKFAKVVSNFWPKCSINPEKWPKTFRISQKWQNFGKSGHTGASVGEDGHQLTKEGGNEDLG